MPARTASIDLLARKEALFDKTLKVAVVGASNDPKKFGFKIFQALLQKNKDVVPVNPNRDAVLGHACLKSLHDLPDPTHTAVVVVIPPAATIKVLQDAKALGIPYVWIQPNAADEACFTYLKESGLENHCIHSLHPAIAKATIRTDSVSPVEDTGPECRLVAENPSVIGDQIPSEGPLSSPVVTSPVSPSKRKREMGIEKPVKAVKTSEGNTPSRSSTQLLDTADSDVEKFLGYPKFAVLGADQSYGKTVLDYLIANHREAVVITATGSTTVQGISTFKSLSDLPDPTHTAVSIALASEDLLEALQEAKALDIPMIWLQPGMQNDTITKYIADNGLAARCIYPESLPQSDTTKSPVGVLKAAAQSVISSTLSNLEEQPCVIKFLSSQGIKAA